MLMGAGLLLHPWLRPRKTLDFQPIGDDLVVVEGWILRADEVAAVFA
jgi:hypothetical protein